MKRTLIAALVATSAAIGFAGTASAEPALIYGTNANDQKTVQIINEVPATEGGSYVAITSSRRDEATQPAFNYNGKQMLILPDNRTDGTKRVFY